MIHAEGPISHAAMVDGARARMMQYDSMPSHLRPLIWAVNDPRAAAVLYQLGATTFEDAEEMVATHGYGRLMAMARSKASNIAVPAERAPENRLTRKRRDR